MESIVKQHQLITIMELGNILNKSQSSGIYRRLMNFGLWRLIPFNSPHKFKIIGITNTSLKITVPFIRKNRNHVNGIHACALATVCEYISGLSLARELSSKEFRIILKEIQMTYHYQAKMNACTTFSLPTNEAIIIREELKNNDATFRRYAVEVYDEKQNHICTGNIYWQIKPWNKTKTTN